MFNSGILDVVIGVVVVYLQLSLVCTAFNELVALWLKKRSKELEKGIRGLLASQELTDRFYEHPLIRGLRPDDRKPSYIPARTFSLALMDLVRRAAFDGTPAVTAAAQAVAEKEKAVAAAEAALVEANNALTQATAIREAAVTAANAAGDADKPAALITVQEAEAREAAALAQQASVQVRLDAAKQAQTDSETNFNQIKTDVDAAGRTAEEAKVAEVAAAKAPTNQALQDVALAARKSANDAADKLAPSAASLLTEARGNIAGASSSVLPTELKVALLALMDNAGTSVTKAQSNVEKWFDDAMDRVSGVYKRKSHVFIVIIAVIVTVLANVDTLQVADSLSHDKAVRDSLVAAAPELAKKGEPTPTPTPTRTTAQEGTAREGTAQEETAQDGTSAADAPAGDSAATAAASPTPTPGPTIDSIKASLDALNKLSLPIGYIRVCTLGEENRLAECAAVTKTRALIKDTEEKKKSAETNSQKAKKDLEAVKQQQKTTAEANKAAPADQQAETKIALTEAETALGKAERGATTAQAELSKATAAHEKALAAKPVKLQELETALEKANEAAKASPADDNKKEAAKSAQLQLDAYAQCPICRKASELTADQLTRRLPTTHDHPFLSEAGIKALATDSFNLLYTHWLGWLLTAMAISLGAPFWFDMLNKLMVVRSTVKPHEKSREQESKDNPDEKNQPNKS